MNGDVVFYVLAERPYSGQQLVVELTATADGYVGSALTSVDVLERDATLALDLPRGNVYAPGQTFDVFLSGGTLLGEPLSNAPLQLAVKGWDATQADYVVVIQSVELTTDSDGNATLPITIAESGRYQLYLSGLDTRGNSIQATRDVYAYAEGAVWPSAGLTNPLHLVADRRQYAPGETAAIWIESALSGPALLTVERGTVRQAQLINLTAPVTRVALPIAAEDAPNVYLTVQAWQLRPASEAINENTRSSLDDATLYTAELNLPVLVVNKQLTLSLTPDKTDYAPGEAATVHLRVTDANGAPVAAQLSLALVDEQAFALHPNASANLFGAFYHQRSARSALYYSQAPGRLFFWDEGGGCWGEASYPQMLWDSFRASPWWEPALVTDANGEVTVTVNLPGALAHWRLTAVAVTAETQVGEAALTLVTAR